MKSVPGHNQPINQSINRIAPKTPYEWVRSIAWLRWQQATKLTSARSIFQFLPRFDRDTPSSKPPNATQPPTTPPPPPPPLAGMYVLCHFMTNLGYAKKNPLDMGERARACRPAFSRPTVSYNPSRTACLLHPPFAVRWAQRVQPVLAS
jgi:hypothetical protein